MDQLPTVTLNIDESDIEDIGEHRLAKLVAGKDVPQTLGSGYAEPLEDLMNLIPQIVAKKISKMIPTGFSIAELSFSVKIRGNFLICGLDGDVQVKIKPEV